MFLCVYDILYLFLIYHGSIIRRFKLQRSMIILKIVSHKEVMEKLLLIQMDFNYPKYS